MTDSDFESRLPRVDNTDLSEALFDRITDESHKKQWEHFARTNPILAREILVRAKTEASLDRNNLDITKRVIDSVSFAVAALELASKRKAASSENTNDGDGVEDPQPLA
jgi:hypothetical protein